MQNTVNILRWVVRLCFVVALLLGLAFWIGKGNMQLVQMHQGLGYLIMLALLGISAMSFGKRGIAPALSGVGIIWALALPAVGHMQTGLLPGRMHWVIQVLHLLVGVGAMGLSEVLGARVQRAELPERVPERV